MQKYRSTMFAACLLVLFAGSTPCNAYTFTLLHQFVGLAQGKYPEHLTYDKKRNSLFGTTVRGGDTACSPNYGCGIVFELTSDGNGQLTVFQILHTFEGNVNGGEDGESPNKVSLDKGGNVYGTTGAGGDPACGCGIVFMLSAQEQGDAQPEEHILHVFEGGADGGSPAELLVDGSTSVLYGATAYGGNGFGDVFSLTPNADFTSWTYAVLYSFQGGADGAYPSGFLVKDSSGNLYGTTSGGGKRWGTTFELSPNGNGWNKSTLFIFPKEAGIWPFLRRMDSSGNFFGFADYLFRPHRYYPGLYELSPSQNGWLESTLHGFSVHDAPVAESLTEDSAGDLFGVNEQGENRLGNAYELINNGGRFSYQTIFYFSRFEGAGPSDLVIDASGTLYGTGGGSKAGQVFMLTP